MKKIKVLIVDDSQLIVQILSSILSADPAIEVVGTAEDPYEARDKIKTLNPDVITLDIEMPKMDGITFLRNIMRLRPLPVVMISTLTEVGAAVTLEALEIGAVDFIPKPKSTDMEVFKPLASSIRNKVRQAAKVNATVFEKAERSGLTKKAVVKKSTNRRDKPELIVIGASTGGTLALKELFSALPAQMPPIAVVQHMPEGFTASFAERLNANSDLTVVEMGYEATELLPGHAYIARGDKHMVLSKSGAKFKGMTQDSEPVNRHKPSVDVLFDSVAEWGNNKILSMILTGMGADGAQGMLRLRNKGALTVAQDEASCVVWGMPRVAVENNAAEYVLALDKMPQFMVDRCA
ncbi:protein-glutamate methylesterase/protein-glutamine glutaminase [Sessilibacter corallicola]|uniref:Protein-glutamate methylesterase/protein-glutamine glutaminase n=1 Tax=Sessilibacter corallicola TaxID=2904075 RepID=A0ABQ0AC36_9GAMM|nr:chemotaxis response regulator protein-glutamate methylesterase [Sessilibacter corallicola]MCE2027251.1 chemotaxis response regulator protein-glutamate methylesterase [Sessilibacter corallicola]